MMNKKAVKKGEGKMVDLSDDRVLKILFRECKKAGYSCRLGKTGLFVGSAQEGLGASAAIDSYHLHLFRTGPKVTGLATFLGKDIGLTGEQRAEKMHEKIDDFETPPAGIPESLQEASEYVAMLLGQIKDGSLVSDDEE